VKPDGDGTGEIILWGLPVSLYTAKVRIALRHKGVAWREQAPPGGYASAEYRARVPQGTIPAIEHGGSRLADSEAILEWLDERFPDPPMLPGNAEARAVQRMIGRYHDTRLEPALRALFPMLGRRPVAEMGEPLTLLARRLDDLAALPRPAPLAGGNRLSLADCGFPVTFAWIEALSPAFGLGVSIPAALDDWRAALAAEPAVAAEIGPYRGHVAAWIAGRQA
jgi:glutathione S-transferase